LCCEIGIKRCNAADFRYRQIHFLADEVLDWFRKITENRLSHMQFLDQIAWLAIIVNNDLVKGIITWIPENYNDGIGTPRAS
jgi:hypothetical protein